MSNDLISKSELTNLILDSKPDDLQQSDINFLTGDIKVSLKFILNIIDNAPTVDIKDEIAGAYNEGYMCGSKEAEKARPQGEWKLDDTEQFCYCSNCEDTYYPRPLDPSWDFCPHCGADMKGGAK